MTSSSPTTPNRVAIYARVSTKNKQEAENQLAQLRQYVVDKKLTVTTEYVDRETGTGRKARKEFERLFLDAHQAKFDTVLFWSLDRFSREGTTKTLNYLSELESHDVGFVSYTEPYLSTLGHFKDAIIAILASLAKQESIRFGERVKAGMEQAKRRGQKLGRPRMSRQKVDAIRSMVRQGIPKREIARQLRVDPKTVRNYMTI